MMDADWPQKKQGAMNVLAEAREKGLVRTHGVSCHTLDALKTAANTEWVQVDLARINPAGIAMDAKPEVVIPVLRDMKAKGKGIIGMKIFGAGHCVDVFTIGTESRAELQQLITKIPEASVRG
jgi:predicted aldo/keto reductase-like oxidoreductase